jgi:hypothetical protein
LWKIRIRLEIKVKGIRDRVFLLDSIENGWGARCAGEVAMFSRISLIMLLGAALVFSAGSALALTADIYGYTKARHVTGSLRVSEASGSLELTGFTNVYPHPLEVYISKGYDLAGGRMVGVLSEGFEGSTAFDLPETGVSDEDMVYFIVPGWTVPVAVGLFREEGTVYYTPPESQ